MVYIIGIDAATKSLALSVISYRNVDDAYAAAAQCLDDYRAKKLAIGPAKLHALAGAVDDITEILTNRCVVEQVRVVDLLPGQKVNSVDVITRAHALAKYMAEIDVCVRPYINAQTHILIEYQMGPNDKSRTVSHQIIYHMVATYPEAHVHIIGPSAKNKLYIEGIDDSRLEYHMAKHFRNYTANKNHAKALLRHIVPYCKEPIQLAIDAVAKKNMDDVADAVTMSISWAIKNIGPLF
jgi:hypothetical protein